MKTLENAPDKALADIKSGKAEEGLASLKDILTETKARAAHDKALATLAAAGPLIGQQADALAQQGKYQEAEHAYESAIRAHLMLAEAKHQEKIEPPVDELLRSMTKAAKAGGIPQQPFRILNEVLAIDPEEKTANMELASLYLVHSPPDYSTAADLMERAGAPDAQVAAMRARGRRH